MIEILLTLFLIQEPKTGGDVYEPCPTGSQHLKIDGLTDPAYRYEAQEGYVVYAWQSKAGRHHDPQRLVEPPAVAVDIWHSSGKDLSHVHICEGRLTRPPVPDPPKPPPPPEDPPDDECLVGDPCWCDQFPDDAACVPPEPPPLPPPTEPIPVGTPGLLAIMLALVIAGGWRLR